MPEILLNDERVNRYGFRVLTAGIDLANFERNPILLYNHQRSYAHDEHTALPLGKWNKVRKEGNLLIGEPELDQEDETAAALAAKLQAGYVNAASIGIRVIEWSEDPQLMLPGQTQPTVTKCELQEVSLVDIPANPNCVKLSYHGASVSLRADAPPPDLKQLFFNKKTEKKMDKELLKALGLPDDTTPEQAALFAANLKAEADKAAQLLAAQKQEQVKLLVESAKQAGKITTAQEAHFAKLAQADYETTKATLDAMQPYKPISQMMSAHAQEDSANTKPDLVLKYDSMATAGTLAQLKAQNPDEFAKMQAAKVQYERETLKNKGLFK